MVSSMKTYIEYLDPEGLNVPTSIVICSKDDGFTRYIEEKLSYYPVYLKLMMERRLLRTVITIEVDSTSTEGIPISINTPISLAFLSTIPLERRRGLIQTLVTDLIEWLNEETEEYRKDTIRLLVN